MNAPRATAGPVAVLATLLLGATACLPPTGTDASDRAEFRGHGPGLSVDVMSFNIRFGTADDGDDSWPNRAALVADVIRSREPDVVGLQEAMLFQVAELATALPGYRHTGRSRESDQRVGEAIPIFYDATRWTVDEFESGTFWLSDTPDVPGSMSWGNKLPRVCTWARLIHRDSDTGLYVYNLHLDHRSENSRARSAALVAERVAARRHPDPVVVIGDFNAEEGSAPVETLLHAPVLLRDSYRALHPHDTSSSTFHAFTGERTGRRIDYILVGADLGILEASIARDQREGRYPSDHFPVTATLELPTD